jgi:CRP/FNR family transcriptional regulator, anaerobic regulatory protein
VQTVSPLRALELTARAVLGANPSSLRAPEGTIIFRPGDRCTSFPIIIEGTVRVQRVSETARLLVLYRIAPGESCILTTACVIADEPYAAEGVCETPVLAYALSPDGFQHLMDSSAAFRAWVFEGYGRRIAQLMSKLEEIVCKRIDVRLATHLLSLAGTDQTVRATQEALAADLSTAREVTGRALRQFERLGWVKCSRGTIEILDRTALRRMSPSE